jgi:hypothetical protein
MKTVIFARSNLFSACLAKRSIAAGTEKLCWPVRVIFTLHSNSYYWEIFKKLFLILKK